MKYLTWKKKLKLALHLCLQVATTVCWKSRTFLVLKPMLFAIRYLLKLFFFWLWNLICSEKISWQQEKVLLDFKRKVNKGKETSIGSFQDKTEVIIFVWYWTYTNGKKIIFMNFIFFQMHRWKRTIPHYMCSWTGDHSGIWKATHFCDSQFKG